MSPLTREELVALHDLIPLGPYATGSMDTDHYYPHVVFGDPKGKRYSDGSGDDKSAYNALRLTINIGPDPDDMRNNIIAGQTRTCRALATLIAQSRALLEEVIERRTAMGDP